MPQRVVVIPYRRFGTTYRSHLLGSRIQKDGTGCSATSVRKCHYSLPNGPEQRSSQDLPCMQKTAATQYFTLYVICRKIRGHAMCVVLTSDAGLLARSQYPGGPATGHLDTSFSWFPCVYERMLKIVPKFPSCLSCSPPDLNFLITFFIFVYM